MPALPVSWVGPREARAWRASYRSAGGSAEEIRSNGGEILTRRFDVTDRAYVAAFADAAHEAFGRVDVIVNNAGVMPLSLMSSLKVDEWDRMVDVNIKGVLYGIAQYCRR